MTSNQEVLFDGYTLTNDRILSIEEMMEEDLIDHGAESTILIDSAGNIVAEKKSGSCNHDLYSLAALASANYAAVETMARILGEEEFSLLFHKGSKGTTHFWKVNEEFLLITTFNNEIPVSLIRLRVEDVAEKINELFQP